MDCKYLDFIILKSLDDFVLEEGTLRETTNHEDEVDHLTLSLGLLEQLFDLKNGK